MTRSPADAIIVGGGLQGATVAYAFARRGRHTVLLERAEPGSGASGNSFGIAHGGLRYLQSLDLRRWHRSRRAQLWFLEHAPEHVRPLPCIMPLYRGCVRSPALFRAAFLAERMLFAGSGLNVGLPLASILPREALGDLPVPQSGLIGAARWFEYEVVDAPAMIEALLSRSAPFAVVRTGLEACGLEQRGQDRLAVRARDLRSGAETLIDGHTVIDCAGSRAAIWSGSTEARPMRTLAFNLLFDLPAPTSSALAVSPSPGRGRSFFIRPAKGRLLAGTWYRPLRSDERVEASVRAEDISAFVHELDAALPGLGMARAPILEIQPGILPSTDQSGRALATKDHFTSPRPNMYTVVGTKLTTAPLLSEEVVERVCRARSEEGRA